MSRPTPLDSSLMYQRDASFWRYPSTTTGGMYHKPSAVNEGWAACSSRILLDNSWGSTPEEVDARDLRCRRKACQS